MDAPKLHKSIAWVGPSHDVFRIHFRNFYAGALNSTFMPSGRRNMRYFMESYAQYMTGETADHYSDRYWQGVRRYVHFLNGKMPEESDNTCRTEWRRL